MTSINIQILTGNWSRLGAPCQAQSAFVLRAAVVAGYPVCHIQKYELPLKIVLKFVSAKRIHFSIYDNWKNTQN